MALEGSTFSAKKFERVIQAWVSPTQSLSCQQLHNIMAHDASDRDGPNEKNPAIARTGAALFTLSVWPASCSAEQHSRDRRAGLAQGAVVDLRHLGQDRPLGAQPD